MSRGIHEGSVLRTQCSLTVFLIPPNTVSRVLNEKNSHKLHLPRTSRRKEARREGVREGGKEGRKEGGKKEGRKEGKKEGRKEGREEERKGVGLKEVGSRRLI